MNEYLAPGTEPRVEPYHLTIEDLKNKSSQGAEEVFALSFEYLLAGVAKEYLEINKDKFEQGGNTIEAFNLDNRLTPSAVIAYPFFIAVSNGHAESLFHLFGHFYTSTFGPASISIYNLIERSNNSSASPLHFFRVGAKANPIGIEVMHADSYKGLTIKAALDKIQRSIKDCLISFAPTGAVKYCDITIESDYREPNPLYVAINSGIKAIKDQSHNTFFDADSRGIMYQAKYFKAFQRAYNENRASIIDFSQIESPAGRPFYKKELVY